MDVIEIKTIKYGPSGLETLISCVNEALINPHKTYLVSFSSCSKLTPSSLALLGGLAHIFKSKGGKLVFNWQSFSPPLLKYVKSTGFYSTFTRRTIFWRVQPKYLQNDIPYLEHIPPIKEHIISDQLQKYWLNDSHVRMSPLLKSEIIGKIWEIYGNCFEHSKSNLGAFTCGLHDPKQNQLKLSVVDLGKGIPNIVKNHLNNDNLSSIDALAWALVKGNSTRKKGTPGGMGFNLLREFVTINNGRLSVYSDDCYAIIENDGIEFGALKNPIPGTVVNFTFKEDEKFYMFEDEYEESNYFRQSYES